MFDSPPAFAEVSISANPGRTSISTMAGSAEFGPAGVPLSVGLAGMSRVQDDWSLDPSVRVFTAFGRLRARTGAHEWSALLGPSWQINNSRACAGSCEPIDARSDGGLLVGASWTYTGDWWWIRLTPQYTFAPKPLAEDGLLSGIPLAEGWVRIAPRTHLGLRFGMGLFAVGWRL